MKLKELIGPIKINEIIGDIDKEISGLTADSRKVADGWMFVAVRGVTVDAIVS